MAVRPGPDGGGRPTVGQVVRDRRFRLGALAPRVRPGAVAVLVVIIAWSAVIALDAAGGGVTADALGGTSFGLMGVPGWGPPAVRVRTVAALAVAVVVAAGAAVAAGWPEGAGEPAGAAGHPRRGRAGRAGPGDPGVAGRRRPVGRAADGPGRPGGPARWVAAFRVVAAKGLVWSGAAAPFLAYLAATGSGRG